MPPYIDYPKEKRETEMDNYISRYEHDEFCKRMDDEHGRINHRVQALEDEVHEIGSLTTAVQTLATNMENMIKTIEAQGKKLELLESRDGEKWRSLVGYVVTALVGAVMGYFINLM